MTVDELLEVLISLTEKGKIKFDDNIYFGDGCKSVDYVTLVDGKLTIKEQAK